MNYQKIYQNLIEKRQYNPVEGYSESHHIIPRCIGGSDNYENLIYLSAREHFIAHVLLVKIYKNKKLLYAANMMSNFKKYNSKQYSWLKELHFNTPVSEETKKKISEGNKGKKKSKEHCLNMSKALSGRKMSKEWIEKSAKSRIGLKRSEETKQKMSEKATSNPSRGMLGKIHSKKTKKKISEGNKGKKVSEETKIKISIKAKERLSKSENNPMYGKKHSEETKEKFRLREQRKREKKLLLDSNDE